MGDELDRLFSGDAGVIGRIAMSGWALAAALVAAAMLAGLLLLSATGFLDDVVERGLQERCHSKASVVEYHRSNPVPLLWSCTVHRGDQSEVIRYVEPSGAVMLGVLFGPPLVFGLYGWRRRRLIRRRRAVVAA